MSPVCGHNASAFAAQRPNNVKAAIFHMANGFPSCFVGAIRFRHSKKFLCYRLFAIFGRDAVPGNVIAVGVIPIE